MAQISAADLALLDKFKKGAPTKSNEPASKASGQPTTLADLIMAKMANGGSLEEGVEIDENEAKLMNDMDPKIV